MQTGRKGENNLEHKEMECWDSKRIQSYIQKLQKNCQKLQSNYYGFFQHLELYDVLYTENSILFGRQDGLVYRIFFYTGNMKELTYLLMLVPKGAVIDIITRKPEIPLQMLKSLEAAGYKRKNTFERYHISNLKSCIHLDSIAEFRKATAYVESATEADSKELLQILYDTFDPKQSHLETLDELKDMIQNQQVKVIRDGQKIAALLTFRMQRQKLYMEHLINTGIREYAYGLYLSVLEDALSKGIHYVDTWIAEDNLRSQRFSRHFGYKKEGLLDLIFVKES